MFSIICESCTARLKVRNVSLIGQSLACPKCGQMIQVNAPEGFVPPPSSQSSMESVSDESGLSGMADFDDIQSAIDEAIEKTTAPKIVTGNKSRPGAGPAKSSIPQGRAAVNSAFIAAEKARSNAGASADSDGKPQESDLATGARGDWSSRQTRNRRKILLASLATVLVVLVAVALIYSFGGKRGSDPVAVTPAEENPDGTTGQNGNVDQPEQDPKSGDPESNPGDPTEPPATTPESTNPAGEKPETEPSTAPLTEIRQDPNIAQQNPAPIPGLDSPTQPSGLPESPIQQPPQMPEDPLKRNFGAGIQAGLAPDASAIPDALGELSSLLQQHGTSLTEVANTSASALADSTAGVPSFYVLRPEPLPPPDLDASLGIAAAKIAYKSVPLTYVLRELSQLGGTPIVWDIRAMLDAGIDPRTPVTIEIVNGTLADALNEAAKQAGLELLPYPFGLGLVPEGDRKTVTKTVTIVRSGTKDPKRLIDLAAEIPKLFAPGTWEPAEAGFGVQINGDQLEVTHNQRTVRQISLALEKLNLLAEKPDREFLSNLASAAETLNTKIELPPTYDAPVEDFLVRLEKKLGITIIPDWSTISESGWNLNTVVPGNFAAEDNRQLMKRLARSMDLDWYPAGPTWFVLTTTSASAATILVEVYPVEKLLRAKFTPENLMDTFRQSAGANLPTGVWTNVYFDGETSSFLVSAPPFVQEQIEAVVARLTKTVQADSTALPVSPTGK